MENNNPAFNHDGPAPPPYGQIPLATQKQANPGYTPVQYDNTDQDPEAFYGSLINASNHPSDILCRLVDALFFYLNRYCTQYCGTQCIEPVKIVWLDTILGNVPDAAVGKVIENQLPKLYDAASVPYTLNETQTPVLDRRGYLHLATFEIRADPAACQQQWNKIINMVKLRDPLTNNQFPTPIPRSAFPDCPDLALKQVLTDWGTSTTLEITRQRSQATVTQGANAVMSQQLAQMQQTMQNAQAMAQLAQMQQAALVQQQAAQATQTAEVLAQLSHMQMPAPSPAATQTSGGLAGLLHLGGQGSQPAQAGQSAADKEKQIARWVGLGVGVVKNLIADNSNGQGNFGQGF